jgi:hypothetical protein
MQTSAEKDLLSLFKELKDPKRVQRIQSNRRSIFLLAAGAAGADDCVNLSLLRFF